MNTTRPEAAVRTSMVSTIFGCSVGLALAGLLLTAGESHATLIGDEIHLNVTNLVDSEIFDGDAVVADAAVDFTFGDLSLDAIGVPKWIFDVNFTGPEGLALEIKATRNTEIDDINGHFRSFEFTDLDWVGLPGELTNATLTGISGSRADKWLGGPRGPAQITAVGPDSFTFETRSWNGDGVVFGDTIIASIQLEAAHPVPEPGAVLLFATGALLVALTTRSKRRLAS